MPLWLMFLLLGSITTIRSGSFGATAASAFIASLSARDILQSSYKSLGQFDRIVEVNEQRVRVGDIGDIELMQSRVDRDQFKIGVISAQADVYSADLALAQELGQPDKLSAQMPVPTGRLEVPVRSFDIDALVAGALQKRSDVLSRQRAVGGGVAHTDWRGRIWFPTSE